MPELVRMLGSGETYMIDGKTATRVDNERADWFVATAEASSRRRENLTRDGGNEITPTRALSAEEIEAAEDSWELVAARVFGIETIDTPAPERAQRATTFGDELFESWCAMTGVPR